MSIVRRSALVVAAMMVSGLMVGAPAEAATATKTICKSFSACETKGYSTHGYRSVYKTSFWNNTAGHNCTNYVAYMLTHNGRMTWRPSGFGDAKTWGPAMQAAGHPIYSTPKMGDVAWWPANYHGVGSLGHVGYVERVYSDGSILLSNDNLGGDFYYHRVYRGNSFWPKGFLRFPKSDGSPKGSLFAATMTNRPGDDFKSVKVSGYVMDPDAPGYTTGRNERVRVQIAGIEGKTYDWSATYTDQWTNWSHSYYLPEGAYAITYWAVNQNAGADTLMGTKELRVSDPTKTVMSVSDYDYRYGGRHYVRGTVTNTADPTEVYPVGTVTVKDGTRVLVTRTLTEADKGIMPTYRLPVLSRGTHVVRVTFTPSTNAFKASTAYKKVTIR